MTSRSHDAPRSGTRRRSRRSRSRPARRSDVPRSDRRIIEPGSHTLERPVPRCARCTAPGRTVGTAWSRAPIHRPRRRSGVPVGRDHPDFGCAPKSRRRCGPCPGRARRRRGEAQELARLASCSSCVRVNPSGCGADVADARILRAPCGSLLLSSCEQCADDDLERLLVLRANRPQALREVRRAVRRGDHRSRRAVTPRYARTSAARGSGAARRSAARRSRARNAPASARNRAARSASSSRFSTRRSPQLVRRVRECLDHDAGAMIVDQRVQVPHPGRHHHGQAAREVLATFSDRCLTREPGR